MHTDHAIREEFFWTEPEKVADITAAEYLEDFTYLYDSRQKDHTLFVQGQKVAENIVFDEIGNPEDYVRITGKRPKPTGRSFQPDPEVPPGVREVEEKLQAIRGWAYDWAP